MRTHSGEMRDWSAFPIKHVNQNFIEYPFRCNVHPRICQLDTRISAKTAIERCHGSAKGDDILLKPQSLVGHDSQVGIQDDSEESVTSKRQREHFAILSTAARYD